MAKNKNNELEAVEIEMTNVELNKRVNELIKICNDLKWSPLEFLFVLKAATTHVQDAHKIQIEEINFERVGLQ